jgi:hypothetical protein
MGRDAMEVKHTRSMTPEIKFGISILKRKLEISTTISPPDVRSKSN